jgi:hypothetical protein
MICWDALFYYDEIILLKIIFSLTTIFFLLVIAFEDSNEIEFIKASYLYFLSFW